VGLKFIRAIKFLKRLHILKILTIIIIAITGAVFFITCINNNSKWLLKRVEYQGFPLHLRYKKGENGDKCNKIETITLKLDKSNSNGLPEDNYNLSLMEFDTTLVNKMEEYNMSFPIIIETFAGKRNFYFFTDSDSALISKFDLIKSKYPTYSLSINVTNKTYNDFKQSYFKEINLKRI
jgi:hypothetical protein